MIVAFGFNSTHSHSHWGPLGIMIIYVCDDADELASLVFQPLKQQDPWTDCRTGVFSRICFLGFQESSESSAYHHQHPPEDGPSGIGQISHTDFLSVSSNMAVGYTLFTLFRGDFPYWKPKLEWICTCHVWWHRRICQISTLWKLDHDLP